MVQGAHLLNLINKSMFHVLKLINYKTVIVSLWYESFTFIFIYKCILIELQPTMNTNIESVAFSYATLLLPRFGPPNASASNRNMLSRRWPHQHQPYLHNSNNPSVYPRR